MSSYRGPRKEYEVFANRLREALNKRNYTQIQVAEDLGFSRSMMTNYVSARSMPESDRLYQIAEYLDVDAAWLFGANVNPDGTAVEDDENFYYLSPETRKIANTIMKNQELSILFDAARDVSGEDLLKVASILESMKRREQGDD